MVGLAKVEHGVPDTAVQRLKPHKLGRHYHKVPAFIREMTARHPRLLSDYFLRNYRIGLSLVRVQVHESVPREVECFYRTPAGKVGFVMDRPLLGELLECYYGGQVNRPASAAQSNNTAPAEPVTLPEMDQAPAGAEPLASPDLTPASATPETLAAADTQLKSDAQSTHVPSLAPLSVPETISSSEQRMRARIGADVAQLFTRMLLGGASIGKPADYDATYDQIEWEVAVEFIYTSHLTQQPASFYLYLDTDWVDKLTARISHPSASLELGSPVEHIKQLPVQLDCVIAECNMNLAQVLKLRLDDIIMVRLNERCDVTINQQKVFRGAVFEENGALFLTSLESVTTP